MFRHIHRADLHRGLLEAATDLGCEVHLDSRVVSIDAYHPSLTTKHGTVFEADLIVASDGKSHWRLSQAKYAQTD
jgi:salicylate hydroxylase